MMTDMRIQNKSRVNKAKSVRFTFNGTTYSGFEGDTLASALGQWRTSDGPLRSNITARAAFSPPVPKSRTR